MVPVAVAIAVLNEVMVSGVAVTGGAGIQD